MQQIMQILMTLPNAPKSAIQAGGIRWIDDSNLGETSLSQIVSEADDAKSNWSEMKWFVEEKEAENCIKVLHLSKKNMNVRITECVSIRFFLLEVILSVLVLLIKLWYLMNSNDKS